MIIPNEDTKRICTKCGKEKSLQEFLPYRLKKSGKIFKQFRCRDCYNEYNRMWRKSKGDSYRTIQKERWHKRLANMSELERKEYRIEYAKKRRERGFKMKDLVYNNYGGYKCACCGETEKSFLTIDHINNDGGKQRKELGNRGGDQFWRWIIKNNFPKIFQVLCWNCQWGKVKNNGICPHRITSNDYPKGVDSSESKRSTSL